MSEKREQRRDRALQEILQRKPLPEDERPLVVLLGLDKLTAEERAALARSPWVPHSASELCQAAMETFQRLLGPTMPEEARTWVGELAHNMQSAEYHLGRVRPEADDPQFDVKPFLNDVKSSLGILARILGCFLPGSPVDLTGNVLWLRAIEGPRSLPALGLAELIEHQDWLEDMTVIRNETTHGRAVTSMGKEIAGRLYVGGLTTEEFCIRIWLLHMAFVKKYLEFVLAIAVKEPQ